ncbi:MAG TPA: DUF5668 domain-containing protein [Acidobacteriota bacterium]|nr:DUF5668 domain-containing protein [Acidobacteriota bacterium]
MKCSYHPAVESQESCNACNKPLCADCSHKIKGKAYCQDCLIEGASWAATIKGLKLPSDSPRRAALCAVIPGLGAVYNGEYLKAITYFAVWAALAMLGGRVSGVFIFGSIVFVIFTMFDAYRSAEAMVRKQLKSIPVSETARDDKTIVGWGIFLIILGVFFLVESMIPFDFFRKLWPLVFVLLGAYLIYRALQNGKSTPAAVEIPKIEAKEDI